MLIPCAEVLLITEYIYCSPFVGQDKMEGMPEQHDILAPPIPDYYSIPEICYNLTDHYPTINPHTTIHITSFASHLIQIQVKIYPLQPYILNTE